jgi:hypothetical protein
MQINHRNAAAAGLRFPETVVEKEYQDYFCGKTFIIAQFAMLLAGATYVVYGAADMAIESGGVLSSRFRFMIALPLMATFFALSFRPFARRHSQAFIIAFGVVAMACTYINVYLIAADSPFRIDNGNVTMNAMLMLGFLALLPLSVGSTIVLGSIVVAVHAVVIMQAGMSLSTSWLFIFMPARCSWSHAALRTGASASTERHSPQSSAMTRRSQEPSAMADLNGRRRWRGPVPVVRCSMSAVGMSQAG